MDLSTTDKIKRQVLKFIPNNTPAPTELSITLSNWLRTTNIANTKFRVSQFYLNNSTIPCFIGKYISTFPTSPAAASNDPGILPISKLGTNATNYPMNTTITATSLDYFINVFDTNTSESYCVYILMDDVYSKFPAEKPVVHTATAFAQYRNRYFHFYNTSFFCELITANIKAILGDPTGLNKTYSNDVDIVRTSGSYTIYLPVAFATDGLELQFSQTLIELFNFRNAESINSDVLFTIIPNTQAVTYNSVVSNKTSSAFVGDNWFPYDELLIKTDMPIEPESFYTTSNYICQNRNNIMLTFDLSNNNPDGIYNFYRSDIDANEGWCSIVEGKSGQDNCLFEILLQLRETGDTVLYTIKQGEKARITLETITTNASLATNDDENTELIINALFESL